MVAPTLDAVVRFYEHRFQFSPPLSDQERGDLVAFFERALDLPALAPPRPPGGPPACHLLGGERSFGSGALQRHDTEFFLTRPIAEHSLPAAALEPTPSPAAPSWLEALFGVK